MLNHSTHIYILVTENLSNPLRRSQAGQPAAGAANPSEAALSARHCCVWLKRIARGGRCPAGGAGTETAYA